MRSTTYERTVNVPSIDDFTSTYRNFGPLARHEARFLFELIMSPPSFIRGAVATLDLELPAVAGIAEVSYRTVHEQKPELWDDTLKRFIGAATCCLMEANGFEKTGSKKAIPHHAFTKGEVYRLTSSDSDAL